MNHRTEWTHAKRSPEDRAYQWKVKLVSIERKLVKAYTKNRESSYIMTNPIWWASYTNKRTKTVGYV